MGDQLARAGVGPGRLHVVPNAYTLRSHFADRTTARRELGLPLDAFIVGWIGRLTPEKGADVLVDAMPMLDEDMIASFIGDGGERQGLSARAVSRAPGRVSWQGLRLDAAHLLRAFDVFVLSSRTEGTPMVLFEAMDAGVPIVATRVGGVPDVVGPREALLVNADDPRSLAAAIRKARSDPQAALSRAQLARARLMAEYAVAPWVERYSAIYRQVIREKVTH